MKETTEEHRSILASNHCETSIKTDIYVLHELSCFKVSVLNSPVLISNSIMSNVLTNFTANLETSFLSISSTNLISNNLIKKDFANDIVNEITLLNEKGRIDESIKELYNFFDDVVKINNIEIIDFILSNKKIDNFPTPVIVSLLNSTKKVKQKLKNRDVVFDILRNNVIEKIGEEKFNKSLYSRLK